MRYAAVVLESDPGNVKSMLRLGQAYHMLGDLLGADRILTKAAALHQAKDALGKALRETLRVVRAKMRSKERRMAHQQQQRLVPGLAPAPTGLAATPQPADDQGVASEADGAAGLEGAAAAAPSEHGPPDEDADADGAADGDEEPGSDGEEGGSQ